MAEQGQWYKIEALWEQDAQRVLNVGGEDVILQGFIPPENETAVCLIPPSITHEQGNALQLILEAQFKTPVVCFTNNIQLCKLVPIDEEDAEKIMGDAKMIQFEINEEEVEETEQ